MVENESPSHGNSSQKNKIRVAFEIIGLSLPLIGAGFAAGRYYERSQNTLEHNDKVMELNKEILRVQESSEETIHELRVQVYELQNELLNYKNHNNEESN